MDTSVIQDGVLAGVYAFLFFLILRSSARPKLVLMLIACAFSTLYNISYEWAVQHRAINSIALFLRTLAAIEACWRCIEKRSDCKIAMAILFLVVTVRIFSPDFVSLGYLNTRSMVTVSVALVCLMFTACDMCGAFESARLYARHLMLQAIWMLIHSAFSLSVPIYNTSWTKRLAARWIYVAASVGIVLVYRHLITNQRVLPGELS